MSHILGPFETAVRIRRALTEDPMSGKPTLSDWDNADELDIDEVLFSDGTTAEFPDVDLETLSALAVLYLPHGADVHSKDRIRIRGALWSVKGRRGDWPGELVSGSVVNLRFIREET